MNEKEEVKRENVDSTDNLSKEKSLKKPRTFKRIINLIIDCVLGVFLVFFFICLHIYCFF